MAQDWGQAEVRSQEFPAGPNRLLVVYLSPDTGDEIDPFLLFGAIALDAAERATRGQTIVSLTATPLRHSAVGFGREGSGYQTKTAIAVVYAIGPADSASIAEPGAGADSSSPEGLAPAPWG